MIAKYSSTFHLHGNVSRRIRKFDRIGEDVDEHLLELHVITDIIVADTADDTAFIMESFFTALGHDHGIQLFQHAAEGEFLFANNQSS